MADLCGQASIWLHVDGAYGGAFAMTERGRRVLAGLGRADSVTLDPHKGLFLPYGTGAILVRDRALLQRSFTVQASYLPEPVPHRRIGPLEWAEKLGAAGELRVVYCKIFLVCGKFS